VRRGSAAKHREHGDFITTASAILRLRPSRRPHILWGVRSAYIISQRHHTLELHPSASITSSSYESKPRRRAFHPPHNHIHEPRPTVPKFTPIPSKRPQNAQPHLVAPPAPPRTPNPAGRTPPPTQLFHASRGAVGERGVVVEDGGLLVWG
jgi:hypothetical protein